MSKKVIAILVAASIISTLIIGCSKKPVEEQPATAVDTTQTEQSVAPAGELIGDNVKFDTGKDLEGELNVWFYEDGKRFIQPLFDDYQKYRPNVKLNVTYIPWGDYWKKLPVAVSGGNGPDVFYFHNMYQILMVDGGLMKPYSEQLLEGLRKDYKGVDTYKALDGNTYYISTGGGHGIIYYNKQLWEKAGLTEKDIPATWEEFREIAIKLTEKEGDKINVAGFNFNPSAGTFISDWSYLSGRFLYNEEGTELMIDNDDFKKTMKFFIDMYQVDGVCNPQFPEYMQSFKDGTTAMLWNHPFYAGILNSECPDLEYGVFPMPKFEGKERNWHYNNPDVSMGINSKIDDKQTMLAEDFMTLFFADDKYMREWDKAQGLAPTKLSLENDEQLLSDPVIQVLMKDYDNSLYIGPSPDAVTQDLIQNLVDPVLKGNASIDDAVKAAVAKAKTTLADFSWKPAERDATFADELK